MVFKQSTEEEKKRKQKSYTEVVKSDSSTLVKIVTKLKEKKSKKKIEKLCRSSKE